MGKILTNQMFQNAGQKDHPSHHGHVKINLFKMMG